MRCDMAALVSVENWNCAKMTFWIWSWWKWCSVWLQGIECSSFELNFSWTLFCSPQKHHKRWEMADLWSWKQLKTKKTCMPWYCKTMSFLFKIFFRAFLPLIDRTVKYERGTERERHAAKGHRLELNPGHCGNSLVYGAPALPLSHQHPNHVMSVTIIIPYKSHTIVTQGAAHTVQINILHLKKKQSGVRNPHPPYLTYSQSKANWIRHDEGAPETLVTLSQFFK